MRYFKLMFAGYGGELTIGSVTKEFVEYWIDKEHCDLSSHVISLDFDDDDVDENSPPMKDGENCQWYEVDDFEHIYGVYADNGYTVVEVDADGNEIGEEESYDFNWGASREAYIYPSKDEFKHYSNEENFVPCLTYHTSEKGYFGEFVLETENDYDPELLQVGVLESELANIVECFQYNGEDIDFDMSGDTRGKGDYVAVGYFNTKWHDQEYIWEEEE